jgi:murein L,D-transpeptidase YafK
MKFPWPTASMERGSQKALVFYWRKLPSAISVSTNSKRNPRTGKCAKMKVAQFHSAKTESYWDDSSCVIMLRSTERPEGEIRWKITLDAISLASLQRSQLC